MGTVPYANDRYANRDDLGFDKIRSLLLRVLTQAPTPLTIGLFGPWGSGKTTLLRMIRQEIEQKRLHYQRTVWFTAWKYDREDALWRAFILRVLDALYPRDLDASECEELPREHCSRLSLSQMDETQRKVVLYLDRLATALYRNVEWEDGTTVNWLQAGKEMLKLTIALPLHFLGFEHFAEKMGIFPHLDRAILRRQHYLNHLSSIEQFESVFRKVLRLALGDEGRLIVFVDDLDRCLPEKAIEVLEAIKVFLDVEGVIFILGMDRAIIQQGLQTRYTSLLHNSEVFPISGDEYLEKLIQIPFHMPTPNAEQIKQYIHALSRESSSPSPFDPSPFNIGETTQQLFIIGSNHNPRQVKRVWNTLWLLHEIAKLQEKELDQLLLAKIVMIQLHWPELYRQIRSQPDLLPLLERRLLRRKGRKSDEEEDEQIPARLQKALEPWMIQNERNLKLEALLLHPLTKDKNGRIEIGRNFHSLEREDLLYYLHIGGRYSLLEKQERQLHTYRRPPPLYDEARRLFQKATAANPNDALSWQAWALMEKEAGNVEEARALFRKATEVNPPDAPSWQAWALMEWKEGKGAEASLTLCERALRHLRGRRDRAHLLVVKARVRAALGRDEEAETAFREALRLDGRNPHNHWHFANFLAARHRYGEANEHRCAILELRRAPRWMREKAQRYCKRRR